MGAQARQNRRSNEILQLHGKITHQEKLRDARGTNKPTKTKSIYKQAKPTDRQQTGSIHSISEMFFTFLTRKNSLRKTFLLECARSGAQQAGRKGGNFGAKVTHLCGF